MRVLGSLALVLCLGGLLLTTTACRPPAFPGTSAGTFAVTETLTTNECAGGFDPDAMLSYTTEIRVQGGVSFWHRGDTPIASGTYTSDGHFHIVAQADVQAYGTDAGPGGPGGCALRQTETIDGTLALGPDDAGTTEAGASDASEPTELDAGAPRDTGPDAGVHSTGFTGTDTITLSVAPGSDCSAIFATNGGPFSALPCTVTYTMAATTN